MIRLMKHITGTVMVLLFLSVAAPLPARSEPAPMPGRKAEALDQLNARLKQEEARADAMKEKAQSAEGDLQSTRNEMSKLTAEVQAAESAMTTIETRIKKLQTEKDSLTSRLEKDYGSISELILALQRIRRVPTETLIMRPGAPLETAQSAMLLQGILPAINTRVETVTADLNRLEDLRTSLEKDRKAAQDASADLKGKQAKLKTLLGKREALYRQSQSDYKDQAEAVTRMAAEAQSLQDLMGKIAQAEKRAAAQRTAQAKANPTKPFRKNEPDLPKAGDGRMPASGTVLVHFGQNDNIGAKSEGLKLKTRPGAIVSAPMGGIVRFTGQFKNYGNMVIIEHQKGYHSLVAGMSRIDTVVGRRLNAGEPVGSMGSGGSGTLYYELRHDGKPVDPSRKIPGLS
ncbi:murein hydrolase activator EnvC family protein [Micavibrio aeruginosavorus]|uniref:murein hydrolase activator EnvC family protein n=1 Tax=Micavibrio aeruginosavorus TaxID=349221 RepID=UPI003F4A9B8C